MGVQYELPYIISHLYFNCRFSDKLATDTLKTN
jgi:hypothetical protein